jgi:hypothetical protein
MTTDTVALADILAAKKADLIPPPGTWDPETLQAGPSTPVSSDYIPPADPDTGEIVPGTAVEPASANATVPAVPAPETRYPEIPPKVVGGLPYIRDYVKLARTIDQTEMVPVAFRGRYDAITAAFMRGYELGLGPMQALDSFNVIEGKVGLSAEAMRALIMQAGHLFILSEEPGVAYVTCRRSDWPESIPSAVYRYDMDDAKIAGLLGPTRSGKPSAWDKNPRAMLAARATSGAARAYFADVLAGMSYTPEEIRDFSGPDQEVTPSPPPATSGVPDAAPASAPTTSADPKPPEAQASPDSAAESQTPPKRPRGRPRKATTPPVAAPGPSVAESSTTALENAPTTAQSTPPGPPELTILNTGDAPEFSLQGQAAIAARHPRSGDFVVVQQMLKVLTQTIKSLPAGEQSDCRDFIRQHFPEGSAELGEAEVQKCIDIAAGWPDSAAQHPIPEDGGQLAAF